VERYCVVSLEGADDSLGADSLESEWLLDPLLAAGRRPWKPKALPFG
jgi:hypothetical protein